MGVDLGDLIPAKEVDLASLSGKKIAVDAFNILYQFLSIIRQPDGTPLMDHAGKITSHLSGIFYRNVRFLEAGILPCYVFDGDPPQLKEETVKERQEIRKGAQREWKSALEKGDLVEARKYAQQSSRLNAEMIEESKQVLDALGLPWIQAPSEGEAQAAHLCEHGDVYAAASQDFDSLLFGTPRFLRNMSVTGKRKLPGKNFYVTVKPEFYELEPGLNALGITREQLVEIGVLVGTDFNAGIKGIGPKKALKAVLDGTWKDHEFDVDPEAVKNIFLKPEITQKYSLNWTAPDESALIELLHEKHDFSKERIQSALQKLDASAGTRDQKSLSDFF